MSAPVLLLRQTVTGRLATPPSDHLGHHGGHAISENKRGIHGVHCLVAPLDVSMLLDDFMELGVIISRGQDQLLTTGDAARVLDVSADLVRRLHRAGKLPAQLNSRGGRLFKKEDVERLAAERRAAPPSAGRPRKEQTKRPETKM